MSVTVVKGKVAGEKTIQTDEPLPIPKGQEVFVVVGELDAESIAKLAREWTREGKGQEAFELLRRHEGIVRQKFVYPFADLVVKPVLACGEVNQAMELARQITDDTDHDIALGHIIFHLDRKGEMERAQALVGELRIPERCHWVGLLLKWRAKAREVAQRLSPEELERAFQDEWGD